MGERHRRRKAEHRLNACLTNRIQSYFFGIFGATTESIREFECCDHLSYIASHGEHPRHDNHDACGNSPHSPLPQSLLPPTAAKVLARYAAEEHRFHMRRH